MGQTAVKSPHTYTFQPTGLLNYDKQLPPRTPQVAVLLTLQPLPTSNSNSNGRSRTQGEPTAGVAGGVGVEPPQQTPRRLSFAPLAAPVLIHCFCSICSALLCTEIWSAKSSSRVICPPSGIVKSQQSVALSRSLSVSYRRELRAPFALCGSHSARGFVSARAPSSAPCLTTHTPIATTAKEVLNNLVYSTPSTPLFHENRS